MINSSDKTHTNTSISRSDFGKDFIWGVSASALQTEGGFDKDGKGMSIWDEFASKKNTILNNDSPSVAANFYENYEEDIALIKEMGIPNFRFSLSWPRILPNGIGEVNQAGIDFYHKVLDCCIANGIEPFVTLYHWDLPLELEKKGGWTNREVLEWFEEYVTVCVHAFKGKVKNWMVLNEPSVFTGAGYFLGIHAPGKKGLNNFLPAMHHALLCQAIGYRKIKALDNESQVGTTFSCTYITPKTYTEKDIKAAERIDTLLNRVFIEPSLGLGYPVKVLPFLKHVGKYILKGDEELIKTEFDFIGLQNYTREVIAHNSYVPYINAKIIPAHKRNVDYTLLNWEIYPKSIYYMIQKFSHYEGVKKILITENGASFLDEVKADGINDKERIHYIQSYLHQVHSALENGGKVAGYFVWSLTDNFEWAEGYKQRFGLVHIDFETQKRTLKNSGLWYRDFLQKHPK
ncbi:GH1 family beta-glucosidase [Flavobacterium sp. XGLA_31]|uniref:GH1 family beta-glucosidase n=1 Tax=Flavobacterium sp. XGLA_31 TaxID=3447666 RepID=UPI003F3D7094